MILVSCRCIAFTRVGCILLHTDKFNKRVWSVIIQDIVKHTIILPPQYVVCIICMLIIIMAHKYKIYFLYVYFCFSESYVCTLESVCVVSNSLYSVLQIYDHQHIP